MLNGLLETAHLAHVDQTRGAARQRGQRARPEADGHGSGRPWTGRRVEGMANLQPALHAMPRSSEVNELPSEMHRGGQL